MIPDAFKQAVLDTLHKGERVDVTKEEPPAAKPKQAQTRKPKVEGPDSPADKAPKPICSRKKRHVEEVEDASDAEPEYVPKKSKSRSRPKEEPVNPAVAKIEAMAVAMRNNAALG